MNREFVLGFMFNKSLDKVALIKKNRPEWQSGLYNGIGGKIECISTVSSISSDILEDPVDAMVREFKEETGYHCPRDKWKPVCILGRDKLFKVYIYKSIGNIEELTSLTDEKVDLFDINNIPNNTIGNLKWLIQMALTDQVYNIQEIEEIYFTN